MSTKLRNRRVAEDKLGTFLEQALVSEDLIQQVMDAPVSDFATKLRLALMQFTSVGVPRA
jgi:hypothetical protein